jgi:acetyl/propionyl-CoA carboxylase alpha subunit
MSFKRIAIVNRGEPAMRFIIAAREYEQEHEDSLRTIALYTDPDRRAMFVREADEAFSLGPATYTTDDGQRKSSYLDYERLERALVEARGTSRFRSSRTTMGPRGRWACVTARFSGAIRRSWKRLRLQR